MRKTLKPALAGLLALAGCGSAGIEPVSPVGKQNLVPVEYLMRTVECDIRAGVQYAKGFEGADIGWIEDIKYAVAYELTVVESKGLGVNLNGVASQFGGVVGLLLPVAANKNNRTTTRVLSFSVVVDAINIATCDPDLSKDRRIDGTIGLQEWQKWLIDTYARANAKNGPQGTRIGFEPKKAAYTVSFAIDRGIGGTPSISNTRTAVGTTSGSISVSQGRKITHKISIVAEELIRPSAADKKPAAQKDREEKLLKDLDQRLVIEGLMFVQ